MSNQPLMCDECQKIKTHIRSEYKHVVLQRHGRLVEHRQSGYSIPGQSAVHVTHYRCADCGTVWQYADDKNDPHIGWTLDL